MTYRPQWLSEGHEDLIALLDEAAERNPEPDFHFDVVVIGSGYGGAVAAARLASSAEGKNNLSVCVLERGHEYVPGAFPSSTAEVPWHVRFSRFDEPKPKGRLDGLFDFRIGADVSALVGSGLGGGSLINAGVAEPPDEDLWRDPVWPEALQEDFGRLGQYPQFARLVKDELEVTRLNAIRNYPKARALQRFAQVLRPAWRDSAIGWQEAEIAVSGRDGPNKHHAPQKACIGCGDCATGCNFGAKNTLPMNYLYEAKRRGARLFTDVTVSRLEKSGTVQLEDSQSIDPLWRIWFSQTSTRHPPRKPALRQLRARYVVVSAGTFGSTEILMRSKARGLILSAMLGKRFSSNGDMISVLYGPEAAGDPVNGAPLETTPFDKRGIGPTITGIVKCGSAREERVAIEELAIPGALRRVFEEIVTSGALPARLDKYDDSMHGPAGEDSEAVQGARIGNTQIFAAMGDDGAGGRLEMVPGWEEPCTDGAIRVDWKKAGSHRIYEKQDQLLERSEELGGIYVRSPLWKPFPEVLSSLLSGPRPEGKLFTVHPLGGCPMGDDAETGVVDHIGRVYDSDEGTDIHKGLLVLDGSIVPTALGINPLLTIAVLAERAIGLYARERGWRIGSHAGNDGNLPPDFQEFIPEVPQPAATAMRFAERMEGNLQLSPLATGSEAKLEVEFSAIGGEPPLADFLLQQPHEVAIRNATLRLDGGRPARLTGTVHWMERGKSHPWCRVFRVLVTWGVTRALADYYQRKRSRTAPSFAQMLKDLPALFRLASNVGEIRHLRYDLKLAEDLECNGRTVLEKNARIQGLKTFKYAIGANPWRQLSELAVSVEGRDAGTLKVDLLHFFRRFAAQFQIVQQRDQPSAILDMVSIAAFMARVVLKVHFWSFRAPEYERYDPDREKRRLPGLLDGLNWERHGVRVNAEKTREHIDLPLTRYWAEGKGDKGPVLLVHGFGASGAQFSHPKQKRNLARHLADQGYDIWIAELRTSIAVETSHREWTLDEVALEDIPAIVNRVCALTGHDSINVVAHCIGSAMFCTAALNGSLRGRVRRAALLQVGPLITLSTGNKFRGRLVAALRRYMLTDHVDSSVDSRADWVDVVIDRMLYTYPYPDSERWAHCLWPPCKPHTHIANCNRSAAVFGRLFPHRNLNHGMLDSLGELLGHTNLKTFEQTVQYAFLERLTDYDASNTYVTEENLERNFNFPVYFVHGELNDVFDPLTTERSANLLREVFGDRQYVGRKVITGYGHLDPLIGTNAEADVFHFISGFLGANALASTAGGAATRKRYPRRPLIGPLLGWTRKEGKRWVARIWCRTDDEQNYAYFLIAVVLDVNGKPVERSAYWAPLRNDGGDNLGTVDMLGLIDVPLPEKPGDYRIAIVGAHASTEADMPAGAQQPAAEAPRAVSLPANMKDKLYTATLEVQDWASADPLPDDYGKAVAASRDIWKENLESGMASPRASDPGYDEHPDSVWLPRSLLERLEQKQDALQFVLASCRYPASRVDREQADAMFGRLRSLLEPEPEEPKDAHAKAAEDAPKPSLLLLAGDQIYADATAGLFDPKNRRERFYDSYREAWTAPHAREVLRRIPTYMMMDDHEIADDWHPQDPDEDGMRKWGFKAFEEYTLASSPRNAARLCADAKVAADKHSYFYSFDSAGFPFFVCDTRTGRRGRDRIMTGVQFAALEHWLDEARDKYGNRPKFVVSPSVVTPFLHEAQAGNSGEENRYAARSDGWEGFPRSLRRLFSHIARNRIRNVVFLCGDPHISMLSSIGFAGDGLQDLNALCIVGSPLYAPFPFANRKPREFIDDNRAAPLALDVENATMQYSVVERRYVPGDSFTVVKVARGTGNGWQITASVRLRDGSNIDTSAGLP